MQMRGFAPIVARVRVFTLAWGGGIPLAGAEDAQVRITAVVANVRSAPSTDSQVIFQAQRGDTLRLIETNGDWQLVEGPGEEVERLRHAVGLVAEHQTAAVGERRIPKRALAVRGKVQAALRRNLPLSL